MGIVVLLVAFVSALLALGLAGFLSIANSAESDDMRTARSDRRRPQTGRIDADAAHFFLPDDHQGLT